MTRDQERARELISLIEGTNLTACEEDHLLTLTSETGQVYTVDREGRWSCNNGRRGDTTALEMELDDGLWYAPPDPEDMPDHRELRHEIAPPLSDYHEDRWMEMVEQRRQDEYEARYDRRMEAA